MQHSSSLLTRAQTVIPGGVNSPVRAFKGVGGDPIFFARGQGAHLYDIDGRQYIDYVGSWGPLILGHAHPIVLCAVQDALTRGLTFGAPTELEVTFAEFICQAIPSIEQVRVVNSGTEATQSAVRLARGFTGRNKILKFEACYHGHSDSLLSKAGSGLLTLSIPGCPGIPESISQDTLVAPFNDLEAVRLLFNHCGEEIAAIIVEPIAANMNCIPPLPDFLPGLRALCDEYGSLLIFDEVITGFRVAFGGAQSLYNIRPDLTCLGKIIGGGLPIGAYGGRKDIMECLAPVGSVYQAGTLAGNPIALTAGLATLFELKSSNVYQRLSESGAYFTRHLKSIAKTYGIPLHTYSMGGLFGLFFTESNTISRYEDVMNCNIERFRAFFHGMLQEGVYLAPSAFEAGFLSTAHTDDVITRTLEIAARVLKNLGHKRH